MSTDPASMWAPQHYGDEWIWQHPCGVHLKITNLEPGTRNLTAWTEIRWNGIAPPNPGILLAGTKNLMGANTARDLANRIKDRIKTVTDIDWDSLCENAVYDVVADHLEGPTAVTLSKVTPAPQGFLVRPLINRGRATSLVGEGGSYKSWIALAATAMEATGNGDWLGMTVIESGPAFYIDYEATPSTHRTRLEALANGLGIDMPGDELQYIPGRGIPLTMWAPALRRRVESEGAKLVTIDSVMLARGGEAKAADNIAFFAALASLGCSVLLVDHKSWEKARSGDVGAYGSIINHNTIGLSWEVRATGNVVSLHPGKNNDFGPNVLQPIGLAVDIESDKHQRPTSATFRHVTPPRRQQGSDSRSYDEYRDIIYAWLTSHGPAGVSTIAKATNIPKTSAQTVLNQGHNDTFGRQGTDWTAIDPELWDNNPTPY